MKPIEKMLDKYWRVYILNRDACICQWCRKQLKASIAHAAHVIPKSFGKRVRWDKLNGICLCFNCHMERWHDMDHTGEKWFQEKFPERWEYLQGLILKGVVFYTDDELEEIAEGLK